MKRPSIALLALACTITAPTGLTAQSPTISAELTADSVEKAEIFELIVHVDVPPGSAVYFPDTVAASPNVESFESVEWRAELDGSREGAAVTLRYPLIPFGEGTIQVAGVDVIIAPAASAGDGAGDEIPGDSRIGSWEQAPGPSSRIQRLRSEELSVWVAPVQTEEELAQGAMPRGPDDVIGFGWSWPNVVLIGLFTSALAAAGATTTKDWIARRRSNAPIATAVTTAEAARLAALGEIDRLLAGGPFGGDEERDLYQASSDVIRRYVERLDPTWGPELTSTELMGRLGEVDSASSTVARELRTAERVKFGRARTGESAVRSYLQTLRSWLSATSEGRP